MYVCICAMYVVNVYVHVVFFFVQFFFFFFLVKYFSLYCSLRYFADTNLPQDTVTLCASLVILVSVALATVTKTDNVSGKNKDDV